MFYGRNHSPDDIERSGDGPQCAWRFPSNGVEKLVYIIELNNRARTASRLRRVASAISSHGLTYRISIPRRRPGQTL